MSIIEIDQNLRNFFFLALGFLMPFSAAAISIFIILLIFATLLDRTAYPKILLVMYWEIGMKLETPFRS